MRETLLQALRDAVAEEPDTYPSHLAAVTGSTILQEKVIDTTRWSYINEVVFERLVDQDNSEYVVGTYADGATEMQDTDTDWEFAEVKPVSVVTTVYETVYE